MTRKDIFDAVKSIVPGVWNVPGNVEYFDAALDKLTVPRDYAEPLAWGAKVSAEFRDKVRAISGRLGCDPSDLMACMAWETGRSFSPSQKNMAGSGAIGLIQFMPATAKMLGTTTDALAKMTAVFQLDFVERYFQPYRGKLNNLADLYMAILWPVAVGKPLEYVLWDKHSRPTTYKQNAGLDGDKDGRITKAECSAKLYAIKAEGLREGNVR